MSLVWLCRGRLHNTHKLAKQDKVLNAFLYDKPAAASSDTTSFLDMILFLMCGVNSTEKGWKEKSLLTLFL